MKPKIVCIVVGAVIGGWIGSSIGIPGFFGFIVGTLPLAALAPQNRNRAERLRAVSTVKRERASSKQCHAVKEGKQ